MSTEVDESDLELMTRGEKLDILQDKVLDGLLLKTSLTERELATAITLLKNNNRVEDKPKSQDMASFIEDAIR